MGMFGARFAVFVRRVRVLPSPCRATRNLWLSRLFVTVTLWLQLVIFTGMARGGVRIPQDGNRANRYEHVVMVHEHDWRMVCSVCAAGARVAQPVPCNS
jgi:hypothetical protein